MMMCYLLEDGETGGFEVRLAGYEFERDKKLR